MQAPNNRDDTDNIYKLDARQLQPAIYGQWKHASIPTTSVQSVILKRTGHCHFYYKNCIYLYGGVEATDQPIEPARRESLWTSFHKFNTSSREYERQAVNLGAISYLFMGISEFAWTLLGNLLFLFGGRNAETQALRPSELTSINLDNCTAKRYEPKSTVLTIKSMFLQPVMVAIDRSTLLVFGGQEYSQSWERPRTANTILVYKLETKSWSRIEDTISHKIPVLNKPFLFSFGDSSFFLFGGRRQVVGNNGQHIKEIQEDGIYRLKLVSKSISAKIDCNSRQLCVGGYRKGGNRVAAMVKYGEKGVFAVEEDGKKIRMWFFDQGSLIWLEVRQNYDDNFDPDQLSFNLSMSIVSTLEKLFIIQNNKIYEFNFNQTFLETTLSQGLEKLPQSLCFLCEQEKQVQPVQRNSIPCEYLEEYSNAIEFPYSAIGLLVDNAVSTAAKNCYVLINTGQVGTSDNKSAHLIIEDNGCPDQIWGEFRSNDFANKINNFYATVLPEDLMAAKENKNESAKYLKEIEDKEKSLQKEFNNFLKSHTQPPASVQKPTTVPSTHFSIKTEKDFEKEQQEYIEKKQRLEFKSKGLEREERFKRFCNSLKIAGIRLGDFVAYACRQKKTQEGLEPGNEPEIRKFYFLRKEKQQKSGNVVYTGYAFVLENNAPIDSKMEGTYKFCAKEFKKEIKLLTERLKTMSSVTLICDLKDMSHSNEETGSLDKSPFRKEMRLKKKQNDVFYGEPVLLNQLEVASLAKMSECCDISLKTYLALLYLNNPDLNLHLTIRENPSQQINTQPYLPTIDKWQTSKKIVELSKALDFSDECSVVEVYWYPEYLSHFDTTINKINGLGFLLNGVLIYHKGRLIGRYGTELGRLLDGLEFETKSGSIFGYLQVKPEYSSNLFGTDFFYPSTLEKYYSRLRFVSQFMENKYRDKRSRGRDDLYGLQKSNKRTRIDKNE